MSNNNPTEGHIRYLSLFSGIEAASVAWQPLGWEAVAFAQYEPGDNIQFPSKVLAYHFPDVPNLGDVTKITEEQIAALGHIDLVVGGSPCFVKGTMVLTEDGYRPIEEINVGAFVLTHKGNLKKVVRIGHKDADTFLLKSTGRTDTIVTGNHPYYTMERSWKWERNSNFRCFSEPTWTEVSELGKDSFLATPIVPDLNHDERLDDETLWILGRYVADGHYRKDLREIGTNHYQYQVIISVGKDKLEEFKNHISTRHYSCYEHSQSVYRCVFSSMQLVNLIEEYGFGKHSYEKQIPFRILSLPKEKLSVFIDGYMSGDGCISNGKHSATTVSEKLALSLALAVSKAYDVMPQIAKSNVPDRTVICGREVNQRHFFTIRWKNTERKVWTKGHGFLWSNIRSVTPFGHDVVYNLEVEDDHTYIANNAVVHNCQDLSVAGKRAGLRNEDGSLTRSGLFDYQVQIYEWARRNNGCRFMLYENVPGAFSSNGGNDFGYILGSMVKRDVSVPRDGWKDSGVCISETGDRIVEWTVLNSADLGVPQRRKRVFALCDSGAWWSRPPILFESEGLSRHFKESEGTFEGSPSSIGKHAQGNGCNTYGWMPRCLQSSPSRDVAQPLTATDYKDPSIVGYQENIGALCASDHKMISNQYVADDKCIVESAFAIRTSNTKANGNGISTEAHSLDCNQPEAVAYKLDSIASNAMKSSNPNSGFHKEDVCCTLDTSDQNPVRNQGGMAVVDKVFVKGTRPHSKEEAPTWKEGSVANTLNTFDLGETRCNELVVQKGLFDD